MTNGHGASASIASRAKLELQRLTLALGAVVQGVSLDVELPQEMIAQIRLALDEHLVLYSLKTSALLLLSSGTSLPALATSMSIRSIQGMRVRRRS